jgi:hypothetical protein
MPNTLTMRSIQSRLPNSAFSVARMDRAVRRGGMPSHLEGNGGSHFPPHGGLSVDWPVATHIGHAVLDHATDVVADRRGHRRKGDAEILKSVGDHASTLERRLHPPRRMRPWRATSAMVILTTPQPGQGDQPLQKGTGLPASDDDRTLSIQ